MKLLDLKKIECDLRKMDAMESVIDCAMNLAMQYNDLVSDYEEEDEDGNKLSGRINKKGNYLMYQLSQQIIKLLLDLMKSKQGIIKKEDDPFADLIKELKK